MPQVALCIAIRLKWNMVKTEDMHQRSRNIRLGYAKNLGIVFRILTDGKVDRLRPHSTVRKIEVEELACLRFVGLFPEIAVH